MYVYIYSFFKLNNENTHKFKHYLTQITLPLFFDGGLRFLKDLFFRVKSISGNFL